MPTYRPYEGFTQSPNIEDRSGESDIDGIIGAAMAKIIDNRRHMYELSERMDIPEYGPRVNRVGVGFDNPLAQAAGLGDIDLALLRQEAGQRAYPPMRDPAEDMAIRTIQGES